MPAPASTTQSPTRAVVALAISAVIVQLPGCGTSGQEASGGAQAAVEDARPLGLIVFRRSLDSGHTGAVFTITPDGSGERRVSHPPSGLVDSSSGPPGFTPDGSKLIFDPTDPTGNGSLWSVGTNGGGEHRVSSLAGMRGDGWPVVSPNRQQIVVARAGGRLDRYQDLKTGPYIMRVDGSAPRFIADFGYRAAVGGATWSPDGDGLVFSVHNNGPGRPVDGSALCAVSPDGHGLHRITPRGDHPAARKPRVLTRRQAPAVLDQTLRPGLRRRLLNDPPRRQRPARAHHIPGGIDPRDRPLVTGREVDRVRQHRRRRPRRPVRHAVRRNPDRAPDPDRRVGKRGRLDPTTRKERCLDHAYSPPLSSPPCC
jgi:hypothetical protein